MSQQKVLCRRSSGGRRRGAAAAVSPVSTGGRDGLDGLGPSCPEGDDSRMAMDASKPIFLRFSSLILGYCPYLSGTTISLLVRLTLHFSVLEGTNGE